MGIHANTQGERLSGIGLDDEALRTAFSARAPVTEELEWGDTSMMVRVIPMLEEGVPNGALMLMRDVSELRRRDRLLLSKDATIREIHHRVKNNLQTIASLLRLQGRRLSSPEAKQALDESVRRIRSIALVHETLAYEAGNTVPFGDVIRPLVRVVEDGLVSPERRVRFTSRATPATFPPRWPPRWPWCSPSCCRTRWSTASPTRLDRKGREGSVTVRVAREGAEAVVDVRDNGVGLPARLLPREGHRARPVHRADAGPERARREHHDEERRRHQGAPAGARRRPAPHRALRFTLRFQRLMQALSSSSHFVA